jgi:hypothetical protein
MRVFVAAVLLSAGVVAGCKADVTTAAVPQNAASATAHHLASDPAKPSPEAVDATGAKVPAAVPDTVAAGGTSAAPAADVAPESARVREITIPAGTTLNLSLTSSVSSKTSAVEDPVNATLQRAIVVNGTTVVPAGSAVSGYVTESTRSGRVKGRARVGVRFTTLRNEGTRYDIRTASIAREAPGTKKDDAVKIGVGAGAGAVVGAIAGGKKGAAIGTAVGAGGGTGVVLATRGEEVGITRGSVVTTRLTAPLTVRVRMP